MKKNKGSIIIAIIISTFISYSFIQEKEISDNSLLVLEKIADNKILKEGAIQYLTSLDNINSTQHLILKLSDETISFINYTANIPSKCGMSDIYTENEIDKLWENQELSAVFNESPDILYTPICNNEDTIYMQEDIGYSLSNTFIKILPHYKESSTQYKLSVAINESIVQPIQSTDLYSEFQKPETDLTKWEEKADLWYKNEQVKWEGTSTYYPLKDSAQFYYKIPQIESLSSLAQLRERLHLKDTFIDYSGEVYLAATLIYKNRPCVYSIPSGIIKIEKFQNKKLVKAQYIHIEFFYGC